MKILLIGEFSSLHKNLKEGLLLQGHTVDIAAMGDGWKNIGRDIDLGSSKGGVRGAIERRINVYNKINKLKGYDIVQLINPFCLFYIPIITKLILKNLKKNNGKVFVLAAGTDSIYLKYARERMDYTPINDFLKLDCKKKKHKYEYLPYYMFNKWVANYVDGIIPIMHEYEVCYKDFAKLLPCIPIPMNIDKVEYSKNNVDGRVLVFHGLNRYGFKGTHYIEQAFAILKNKYSDKVDFLIKGKMSLDDYLILMRKVNIVVDQTSSYSCGVNAIYALAMGKIVLGGAEPIAFKSIGTSDSPVINIKPDVNHICHAIESLLINTNAFEQIGLKSRKYAEMHHDYAKIAKDYVNIWSK